MKKRQTFLIALARMARFFVQTSKPAFMDKRFIFPIALMALIMCNTTAWAAPVGSTYSASGAVLTLSIGTATNVTVQTTGSGNYTFSLASGTWTGAAVTGVSVSINDLIVTNTANLSTINIVDGIAGVAVTFANNITSTYDDNFNVTLDAGSGAVTFNTTSFSSSNAINVVTDKNIVVNWGKSLTTVDGNLTLSANMQATQNLNNFHGISIGTTSQTANTYVKSTGTGNVSITGRGGASAIDNNNGLSISGTTSYLTTITSGGGSVTVAGTGGGTGTSSVNSGINCFNATISSGGNGSISVTGTGGGSTFGNRGVKLLNATISSGGNGSVTVTGTGTGGSVSRNSAIGVEVSTASHIKSDGSGTVQVTGYGSTNCIDNYNYGVGVYDFNNSATDICSSISSVSGNITVNGTGGGSGSSSHKNFGVNVCDPGTTSSGIITTGGSGSVTVTGTGGNGGGNDNYGVGIISSKSGIIANGTGSVFITGNGGGSGTSSNNHGINLFGPVSGNGVTLNGNGGTTITGNYNHGISISSQIYSNGTGVVSVTGTGGGKDASSFNNGVYVSNTGNYIRSASSNVSVTGTGGGTLGTGVSSSNFGVSIFNSSTISAGGTVTMSVIGTGGGKDATATGNGGISVDLSAQITSDGGDVTLEGHEGAGTATSNVAINSSRSSFITTLTNGGLLTLKGNSLYNAASIQVPAITGILNVIPATSAVNMNLGLATDVSGGPIAISNAELARMSGGHLNFGDANTGTITLSAAMTAASGSSVKLTTAATGGVIPSSTGTDLTLTGQTLTFGSGTPLKIDITGNVANTSYQQLKVGGTVDLTGATLSLSGSYTPVDGDVFTIVTATTSRTGTFTGLAEGAQVTFNGKSLIIHYTATAVTLTAAPPAPTITSFSPLTATTTQTVTITGTNFTGATAVSFGGTAATSFTVVSATSITAVVAGGTTGSISVTTPGGTATLAGFTFVAPGSSYSASGDVLTISIDAATTVTVKANGSGNVTANYTFILASGGWTGSASGASASGTTLTVTGLATYNTINIVDGATGVNVTFDNSTTSYTYNDNFNVTLDGGAGPVTFNTTCFSGSNALGVVTDKNIVVNPGSTLSTVDGNLTLSANMQATKNINNFIGIDIGLISQTANTYVKSTGTGNVSITGSGGASASNQNYGVRVISTQQYLSTITSGSGSVTITGYGGGSGTSGFNYGILIFGPVSGNGVTLNGYGGTQCTGNFNYGIQVYSQVSSTGTGVVSVNGTGGGRDASLGNCGVYVYYSTGYISSTSSNVTVTGTGGGTLGSGMSNFNYGIYINDLSKITAGGTGLVSLVGTGGGKGAAATNNYGILNEQNGTITSGGGDVTVEGHEGAGTSALAISFPSSIGTRTNGGTLTLKGNSLFTSSNIQVPLISGVLNVIPSTTAVNIDLGSATDVSGGPIAISNAELARMSGGHLNFGDANTGTITFSDAMTAASGSSVKLTTAATGGVIPSSTGTDFTLTGQTLTFGSGTPLKIDITGNVANTSYQQLKVGGTVDLTGATLSLTGSYTPVDGDVFTIVSGTSVTGTFTGLAEGDHITFNGKSLTINYTATGVTLTAAPSAPTITSFSPLTATTTQTVTITGTNFTGATAVSFGGTAATSFNVASATSITAVVASGSTGSVSVTTPGGTATLAGFTYMAFLTWTGTTSSDWNTASNWNPAHVPTAINNVQIPDVARDPIVNVAAASPADCNNLTIESGAVLTIAAGKALKVNGILTNNAGITGLVVESATGAANGTGALINGTAGVPGTVERYVTGDLWHLISPAATDGETVINFVGATQNANLIARNTNNYALAPWLEETGVWDYYKVSESNTSGKFRTPANGYQVMRTTGAGTGNGTNGGSGKLTFKGTLAAADQSIAVTKAGNGWNLVGNPYPCALDVAKFVTENTALLDPSFQFIYVSKIADVTAYGYDPNTTGLLLASGEGFFVRTIAGGGNIKFTPAMKSSVSDAFKAANVDNPTIRLTAEDGNGKLGTTIQYINGATKGLDPGKDAGLFNGLASSFSLFTRLIEDNGVDFTIQALPDNNIESMVVPVGLVADKGATVTFKAMATNLPAGYKVVLEDKETATFTRLDEANSSYTVSLAATTLGTGRFYLHTTEIVSAIDESVLSDVKVVPIPELNLVRIIGNFDLPAKAMVYDMNGKLVTTSALASQIENDIPLTNCATGVYLLKVDSGKDVETVKFVWKRK